MKRSFIENLLKDLEMEESVKKSIVDSIITENGNDINTEKTKTLTAQNDLKVKEGLIEELNSKIKEADSVDVEKIKKQAREEGKLEGSKEFDEFKKAEALKKAIKGAKDFDLVSTKLDKEKIEYKKDDKGEYAVKGVDEQLNILKEKYSFLFENEDSEDQDISLGGEHKNPSATEDLKQLEEAMGIKQEN